MEFASSFEVVVASSFEAIVVASSKIVSEGDLSLGSTRISSIYITI